MSSEVKNDIEGRVKLMVHKNDVYKMLLNLQREKYDDYLIMYENCEDFYKYLKHDLGAGDLLEDLEIYSPDDLHRILGQMDVYY